MQAFGIQRTTKQKLAIPITNFNAPPAAAMIAHRELLPMGVAGILPLAMPRKAWFSTFQRL